MKEKNENVSRRNFLKKGAVAAGAASILVIPNVANAETESSTVSNAGNMVSSGTACDPTNPYGLDLRSFSIPGDNDITTPLNDAIACLSSSTGVRGGKILIPPGVFKTDGGHKLDQTISVEGVGVNTNSFFNAGTIIKLNPPNKGVASEVFLIDADTVSRYNNSLKNLTVDMSQNPDATGLLLRKLTNTPFIGIYQTTVENVIFSNGARGIAVVSGVDEYNNSYSGECILNRFERVTFSLCETAFYCNTVNSGFTFDNCFFYLTSTGTALDVELMGNMSLDHCLLVSNTPNSVSNKILRTTGQFNNISFNDCQDEGIIYSTYKDLHPFDYVPVVYRNCLIQSKMQFNANGAVLLDSCRIAANVKTCGGSSETDSSFIAPIYDTETTCAVVHLEGSNNFYGSTSTTTDVKVAYDFKCDFSKVIYEDQHIEFPGFTPVGGADWIRAFDTSGIVSINAAYSYVKVYAPLITAETLIFTQLRTNDSNGALIREVINYPNINPFESYFQINLTQAAANKLDVSFKLEFKGKRFQCP